MWLLFGFGAALTALVNLSLTAKGKDGRLFLFLSLSLTALTLCALYGQSALWAERQDMAALMDVTPTVSRAAWFFAVILMLLNGITLFSRNAERNSDDV